MKKLLKLIIAGVLLSLNISCVNNNIDKKYNVLFIAVDDLNDWIGCMDGHPNTITPNIDRLASKGVLFERAYSAAPLCNPSRTALMMGLRPSTTGIYCNRGKFREHPQYSDWVTMPQYFRQYGYTALAGGKIFHQPKGVYADSASWDKIYSDRSGTQRPAEDKVLQHGLSGKFTTTPHFNRSLDWAGLEIPEEETYDWQTAAKAVKFLEDDHEKPFFLACGIFRPHLPWYAPQKYFDMHPLDDIVLPPYLENDLEDVPPLGKRLSRNNFLPIKEGGKWKEGVRAYLANITFADAAIGYLLNSLEKSRYAENTIVVLWGDHGWHLGEKDHWAKFTLWERANRTPLIIYAPGISKSNGKVKTPVSLLDIYPTLVDLCDLPVKEGLDGKSLRNLLEAPDQKVESAIVMTHWKDNHAVVDGKYRYIRYRDGTQELYDHESDPNEWNNLAADSKYDEIKKRLSRYFPDFNAEHFQPEPPENM